VKEYKQVRKSAGREGEGLVNLRRKEKNPFMDRVNESFATALEVGEKKRPVEGVAAFM